MTEADGGSLSRKGRRQKDRKGEKEMKWKEGGRKKGKEGGKEGRKGRKKTAAGQKPIGFYK